MISTEVKHRLTPVSEFGKSVCMIRTFSLDSADVESDFLVSYRKKALHTTMTDFDNLCHPSLDK